MARIVMKFGGTSVADLERIHNAAKRVKQETDNGNQVAVIVSAMSGVTNQLVGYVNSITPLFDAREYDVVVSSGEQVTSGLMALTLQDMGVSARSWAGWQVPIKTSDTHAKARILDIETEALCPFFQDNMVAVIAGFQGVSVRNRITTLGRGGSDTSAVAVAAAINADRCDIYTDVDGVYTTDPRIVPKAKKIDRISHEEMLEMASVGAKVLQTRSVEIAMNYGVRLQVLSSFEDTPGTMVVSEDEIVEQQVVTGIAFSRDEAKIALSKVQDKPGLSAAIFGPLADAGVNVDMIVQAVSTDGETVDMTFTVPRTELLVTQQILEDISENIQYEKLIASDSVVKISVIGVGMRSHTGVASTMFNTLADKNINIQGISTSEIKISVLVDEEYTELAVRALHTAYNLDS